MQARNKARVRRSIAVLGVCAFLGGMAVANQVNAPAAQALDLPTWADVEAAKQNQAAADAKITEVEKLIADGQVELDRRRNLHATTITDLEDAEKALATASEKAATLQTEAETSRVEAEAAADRAGVLVAQMYRSGGVDRSMELFLDADASTADALLERMASMSKATERNSKLSEDAEQTANTADSLGKQADAAAAEREVLRADKEVKEVAAAEAVTTQGALVAEQEAQQRDLEVKLEALKDTTTKTVEGYEERLRVEEEQRRAEAARLQKLAEEEERRRQEEAAQNPPPVQGGGGGGGGSVGDGGGGGGSVGGGGGGGGGTPTPPPVNGFGWNKPLYGYWVSEGFRSPGRWDHTGTDLAAACWTPIMSAGPGYVGLTYWEGLGGNMVTVNHTNGMQTRYAHMVQWASVSPGQWVNGGQVIGYVGTTGASTGCHLHFEMRVSQDNLWYGFVNPQDYIAL